jgi:hypothetical protein
MAKLKYTPITAHNPSKVREDILPAGHRFLDTDEIKHRRFYGEHIMCWSTHAGWQPGRYIGHSPNLTYCTKLTRKQLAELEHLHHH